MSEIDSIYEIRDYVSGDKAFIKATFLRGLYYGDSWFSFIDKTVFMDNYSKIVDAMLDSPNNTVKVACLKEDNNVILGYSLLSADFTTVHWVFVKKAWRLQGVGRNLIPKYFTNITHLSLLGKILCFGGKDPETQEAIAAKYEGCIFNPFKL